MSIPCYHHLGQISHGIGARLKHIKKEELTPGSIPFILSPWIFQKAKPLTINLNSFHYGVSMTFDYAFAFSTTVEGEYSCSASEEKLLVDFENLFIPKVLLVKYVGAVKLSCDTSS